MRANQHFPLADAQALYEGGLSLREVAAQLGCSNGTVRAWLLHGGVALRPRGGANHLGGDG